MSIGLKIYLAEILGKLSTFSVIMAIFLGFFSILIFGGIVMADKDDEHFEHLERWKRGLKFSWKLFLTCLLFAFLLPSKDTIYLMISKENKNVCQIGENL